MEKINELLAKESLDENDIKYLVANIGSVPQEGLVRLGLAQSVDAVKEPVNEEPKPDLTGEAKAALEVKQDLEDPEGAVKRGRGRKAL